MNVRKLKSRVQTLSSVIFVMTMFVLLIATTIGTTIAISQELTVTPTTVPYSTQPQTVSYSVAGGPAGLAYKIAVKAPNGNVQPVAQGFVSSSGTVSGTFSYTFNTAGATYQVAALFLNGARSNVVSIQVSSTTTTSTTTSTSSSTSSSSSSSTSTSSTTTSSSSTTSSTSSSTTGTVPSVYVSGHNDCTADSSAPTTCSQVVNVPANSVIIVFPSTGNRLGQLPSGQTPCDSLVSPPTILSVSSISRPPETLTWTKRGTSTPTQCENVNNTVYPNYGFQIVGGEEWYAVTPSALTILITVTSASANGGSLYSYELNLDLVVLTGVDLSGIFGPSQPCISTGWSGTLSCTVTSPGAGFIVGNGQALNGMCAGTGFTELYHSPLSIQNVGIEGISSSIPVSGLAVTFDQACGVDDNINGGNDIWVMTADVIQ
jgi:hypothetical protein